MYNKVLCKGKGNFDVFRYIDEDGNWIKEAFNGKVSFSKPMPIIKEYGFVNLNIVDEGVFGKRVVNR